MATAVTSYDLISLDLSGPLSRQPNRRGLVSEKARKLSQGQSLALYFGASSRREGIDWLNLPADKIVNLSTAADARFHPIQLDDATKEKIRRRYALSRPFVMYMAGIDHRKNIEGLIDGYALLPDEIRRNHHLAIVCAAQAEPISAIKQHARKQGLGEDELVLTGFVSDGKDLVVLYNICSGFCFPSFHEGF